MSKTTSKPVVIKEVKFTCKHGPQAVYDGRSGWGITDGQKWFFNMYANKADAETVFQNAKAFTEEGVREVNISYPSPGRFKTDLKGDWS